MSPAAVAHTTFVIEREFPAPPRHAFRFWSDADLKRRWTSCHPDWTVLEDSLDFRVGGVEANRWRTPEGDEQTFHAYYLDLVSPQRIIYAYEMTLNVARLSASLVTIELSEHGKGSHMRFTEQTAFTGGEEAYQQRVEGTGEGLDRLVEEMQRATH